MEEQVILDDKQIRVVDILDQIARLNQMIKMHRDNPDGAFMIDQYVHLRERFLRELKDLLGAYQLKVELMALAA